MPPSPRKLLAPASAVVRFRRCGRRSRGVEGLGGRRGDEGERGTSPRPGSGHVAHLRLPPTRGPLRFPPNSGRIILHLITTIRQSPEGPTHMPPGRGAWEESVHILYMRKLPRFFVPHPGPLARGLVFRPSPGPLGRGAWEESVHILYMGYGEITWVFRPSPGPWEESVHILYMWGN